MTKLTPKQRRERLDAYMRQFRAGSVRATLLAAVERARPQGEQSDEYRAAVIVARQFDDLMVDLCDLAGVDE